MSALPRPDLPPGPHRDLVAELHGLHHRAGWPSLRTLAARTGVSHTTVSKVLSAPVLPTWGTLELIVEAMDGDTGEFHRLWLAATYPSDVGPTPVPRIAGRRAELVVVRRHLEQGSGLLLVTGEAGMGKTTLLDAAVTGADVFGAVGHCLPLGADVPFRPIVDALTSIFEVDGGRWLESALDTASPHVRHLVTTLLPHLGAGVVVPGDEYVRQHLLAAVADTFARLAQRRPLALVVEDVHWADPGTLDLLEHLVARGVHLPIVASWRTQDETTPRSNDEWCARVQRHSRVTALGLTSLSRAETATQLALLGASTADVDVIHSRSRGQPLFTEQLATHLGLGTGLPDLLADLLDRRLRGLPDAPFAVMRALGVAERPLTPSQLTRITRLSPPDVTAQLRFLQDRRLVRSTGNRSVEPHHPLLADAVRRRLVPGEAAPVHAATALALAEEDPDAAPAEVAHHWQEAGDPSRELDWRIRAARSAATSFDWRQESEQWLRVLELWPSVDGAVARHVTRAEAYLAAMDALKESLQWDRAADMSDAADRSLGVLSDAEQAELLRRAAEYRGEREGVRTGLDLIDRALTLYSRLTPSTGYVHALRFKRGVLMELGDYEQALAFATKAVAAAEEARDVRLQRLTLSSLAWHMGLHGDVATVHELLERGRALLVHHDDPIGDVVAAIVASDALLLSGGSASAIEAAARHGFASAATWAIESESVMVMRANVAQGWLRAGDITRAEALIGVPADQAPDPSVWPLDSIRALVDMSRGALESATARSRVAANVGPPDEVDLETLCMAAEVDFWSGDAAASMPRMLRELEVVVDTSPVRVVLSALVAGARAAAEVAGTADGPGLVAALGALLGRAEAHVRPEDQSDDHVQTHLAMANTELRRAHGDDSARAWTTIADRWHLLSRPHDAAYCQWRAARAALRDGHGTVAARLLSKAATGAREHVPLAEAIAGTGATGRRGG